MRYFHFCSHEQFPPMELLVQGRRAQAAGFDAVACSDQLQPWWEPGEAAHAWVWLGALAQATARLPFGTGATSPGPRYHPILIAQAWATLEAIFPGRPFLGIGSGGALNESPLGVEWPSVREQVERMEEALVLLGRLFDGERVTHDGKHFKADRALLHTRPARRPPIYVSAFGPRAAAVAGRLGDGLWTLADPERAPEIIDAYRSAADDAGREPGEILLQAGFSWASDDAAALEGCRVWKRAQPPEFYKDEWHDPQAMHARGEREVSDDELRASFIISADPDVHVERIRAIERLGATAVVLANNSGADPLGAIDIYGRGVLPALRRGRAGA